MNVLNIAIKDIKKMTKEKFQLALVLFMPLFMIFLMGNALKPVFNADKGIQKFQVLYVNEDNGSLGDAFDSFMKNGADKFLEGVPGKPETAESEVLSGKYNAAIIIPSGLSDRVSKGEKAYINVICSGRDAVRDSIVNSIVDSFAKFTGVQMGIIKGYTELANDSNPVEAVQKLASVQEQYGMDFVVSRDAAVSPVKKLSSFQYFTLSMLLFFMLAAGVGLGGGIVSDRADRIYNRISSYPVRDREYILGKILGSLMLTSLQAVIVIVFTSIVFKVDWGTNFLGTGITMILMMLISSSIGLVFSSLVSSAKAVNSVMIIVVWMITFMGGGFTPVPALDPIARFTFYRWGLDSLANFMAGGKITDVLNNLMFLLITVIILWIVGLSLYRRRASHE
jgi:ABC-2 type transport system permease protein